MEARAVRKYVRISPRKARVIANAVRGKRVPEAMSILGFLPHRAAKPVERALNDAVHNLMDKYPDERFDEDQLVIRAIYVNEGPMYKRYRPAPRGRAHRIRRRTSHITVVVGLQNELVEQEV